ncbi:MAG: hypothetical protein ACLFUU_13475, partial [Desulfobacteraceae bacterium]
ITQYLVEQPPSPAEYSRGRLFYLIFCEVEKAGFVVGQRGTMLLPMIGLLFRASKKYPIQRI